MSNPSNLHEHHEDHPDNISRNARRGLFLFVIYFVLYAAFIALNVFKPDAMTATSIPLGSMELSLGGPNLAVVSGIGLIFAAFILALIYMRLTKLPEVPNKK
ncbi:MAG TPA: DUF485 domain-containing protein [Phycisphaerae bacterium]|jgi:uncharacterized membrane protein (DUF485 family)